MAKPFISARIPEDLLDQLESRALAEHESKTEVLVKALKEYLDPESSKTEGNSSLERRVRVLEHCISKNFMNLEFRVNALETSRGFLTTNERLEGKERRSLPATTRTRPPQLTPRAELSDQLTSTNNPVHSC